MKWDTREENLILEVIENHRKLLRGEESKRCPFCKYHIEDPDYYCTLCPNKRISDLLGLLGGYDSSRGSCYSNLFYFEKDAIEFRWQLSDIREGLLSKAVIKRRIQMWQDALEFSETEFVKKYKKEKKNETRAN